MAHLPSLQTLRAFEAAARHRSYSRAARELGLTHGAISQRIRELELRLGAKLFLRQGREMVPTPRAGALLAQVRHALSLLESAFAAGAFAPGGAPAGTGRRVVRLTLLPAFATRWLYPRLAAFRQAHPDIELELRPTDELVDLNNGDADAAIRYGGGVWPETRAERLTGEVLLPVCAPELEQRVEILTPEDLGRCVLLRHPWQPWAPWFRAAGVALAEPVSGPVYADAGLLLQAAIAGEGVALARGLLALDDLEAGRLVRLFEATTPDVYAYHFVRPARPRALNDAADLFERWLAQAMAADIARLGGV